MGWTYVGDAVAALASGSSLDVPIPAGAASGDLLVCLVRTDVVVITVPAELTAVNSSTSTCAYAIYDSGWGTISYSNLTSDSVALTAAYRPSGGTPALHDFAVNSSTSTVAGVDYVNGGLLVLCGLASVDTGNKFPPPGYAERREYAPLSGGEVWLCDDITVSGSGSTGTLSTGGSNMDRLFNLSFELPPSGYHMIL